MEVSQLTHLPHAVAVRVRQAVAPHTWEKLVGLKETWRGLRDTLPRPALRHAPLLSVVMAGYNTAAYVEEAFDSLKRQQYRNIDVIVVNDDSSDTTPELIRQLIAGDDRFRLLETSHRGPGAARNLGAAEARGRYIAFFDSDDIVEPLFYRDAIASLEKSGSDFAIGPYDLLIKGRRRPPAPYIREAHRRERTHIRLADLPGITVNVPFWARVYRRDFYDRAVAPQPEGVLFEDQLPAMKAFVRAEGFDVLRRTCIQWRRRVSQDSITQRAAEAENLAERVRSYRDVADFLDQTGLPAVREERLLQILATDQLTLAQLVIADQAYFDVARDFLTWAIGEVDPAGYAGRVPLVDRVCHHLILTTDLETVQAHLLAGGNLLRRWVFHPDATGDLTGWLPRWEGPGRTDIPLAARRPTRADRTKIHATALFSQQDWQAVESASAPTRAGLDLPLSDVRMGDDSHAPALRRDHRPPIPEGGAPPWVDAAPKIEGRTTPLPTEPAMVFQPPQRGSMARPRTGKEQKTYDDRVLRCWYWTHRPALRPKIYLQCFEGEDAGDTQLALARELGRRGLGGRVIWGVADSGHQVVRGQARVSIGSPDYFEALATSAVLCFNSEAPGFLVDHAGQTVIQTYHGHPFKTMGYPWWTGRGETALQMRLNLESRQRWDVLLSPSPLATRLYQQCFPVRAAIWEIGSPRNDSLVAPQAGVREEVRQVLGLEAGQIALLYAPTYRGYATRNPWVAPMVGIVDPLWLSRSLGGEFVILMRGHPAQRRAGWKAPRASGIVDVTRYPDINSLMLASDCALFDYSSARFDYALTDKPMAYITLDQQRYFAGRTPLWPYEDTLAGPWLHGREQLPEVIRQIVRTPEVWAPQRAALRQLVAPRDDGQAASRLADRVAPLLNRV